MKRTTTILLLSLLAASAAAQTTLHRENGGGGGSMGLGLEAVAGIGDVSPQDGIPDVAIGDPGSNLVRVLSGADFSLIGTINGLGSGTFGWAIDGGADLDGDMIPDIVIGEPGLNTVTVYSGATLGQIFIDQTIVGSFGWSVAVTQDVDLDGFPDTVAGAPGSHLNGGNSGGGIWRSGGGAPGSPNPTRSRTFDDGATGVGIGYSVDGIGDVDNDGQGEVLISTVMGPTVSVYSGMGIFCVGIDCSPPPGELIRLTEIQANSIVGLSAKSCGDFNGDGFENFMIGAIYDPAVSSGGIVRVYEGKEDMPLLHELKEEVNNSLYFGASIGGAGDFDGDSVDDLIVGHFLDNMARVYSGDTGKPIFTWRGDTQHDGFGFSVAGLGDVDGDGRSDVVVGSQNNYAKVHRGVEVFAPGDRLDGTIANATDDDQIAFWALEGMGLKVRIQNLTGNVTPDVKIFNALGMKVADWSFKFQVKTQKRKITLPQTGMYRLVVTGRNGTLGNYRVRTRAVLPALAVRRNGFASGKKLGGIVEIPFLGIPGATLTGWFRPAKGFPGHVALQFITPDGDAQVIIDHVKQTKLTKTKLKDVPIGSIGKFKVVGYGAEQTDSLVEFSIRPFQPKGTMVVPID